MSVDLKTLTAFLSSKSPPRDKAAAGAAALRAAGEAEAGAIVDALYPRLSALKPLVPRSGKDAGPFLALISAAAAADPELAAALGLLMNGLVEPLDPDGPAGRFLSRATIDDLQSRRAIWRTAAAFGAGAKCEALRLRYASLHPYWRDPDVAPGEGKRVLILNRLPNVFEKEARFVHNQSNLPHGYAEIGVAEGFAMDVFFVVGSDFDAVKDEIERPDAVYNNILSAEVLEKEGLGPSIRAVADHFGAPLVNPPGQCARLSRSANYEWIGEREEIAFPKTRRFEPGFDPAAVAREIEANFEWPAIVRDVYGHMGAEAHLVGSIEEAQAALDGLSARGAYAIQFHDHPQWNGLYCRYRIFKIRDHIFPSRIHFAEGWNVHGAEHDALKETRPELGLDALEVRFWEEPTSLVPEPTWRALEALLIETGADVVGCDFTLTPEGRALIFEVNGSMHVPIKGREAFERLCGFRNQDT